MTGEPEDPILRVAERVARGEPVEWDAVKGQHPELEGRLAKLELLASIAEAVQSPIRILESTIEACQLPELPFQWGHLRVEEYLGKGGSGEVFRAHDTVLDRDVALKLRASRHASDGAYISEARRLASVRHPHVLAVHGAARNQGRVGLWTDLIHGETLEQVIARSGRLAWKEVLDIAMELASALRAVQEAGLIHGDIKAANVMVEAGGRVVLMDFGAGQKLAPEGSGRHDTSVSGTPLVMAPELFEGIARTPESDIYSLGVLLFRLLSGQYPLQGRSVMEIAGQHAAQAYKRLPALDNPPPRALVSLMYQMMDPTKESRPSATDVIDRLRWIRDIPRRRARNLRLSLVMGLLVLGTILSSWGFVRARLQAAAAKQARAEAERINEFLQDMLASPDPAQQGRDVKMIDVVDRAAESVGPYFADHASSRATTLGTLGWTYYGLGEYSKATSLLFEAQSVADRELGRNHKTAMQITHQLAVVEAASGQYEKAEQLLRDLVGRVPAMMGEDETFFLTTRSSLGLTLQKQGKFAEAEQHLRFVLDRRKALFGVHHESTASALNNYAIVLSLQGKAREAMPLFQEGFEIKRALLGERHPKTIQSMENLSIAFARLGQQERACELQEKVLKLRGEVLGALHPKTLNTAFNLAVQYGEMGHLQKAFDLTEETRNGQIQTLGPDHPDTLTTRCLLAQLLVGLDRFEEAEARFRALLVTQQAVLPHAHPDLLETQWSLAQLLVKRERSEEALPIYGALVDDARAVFGDHHVKTLAIMTEWGAALASLGRAKEARTLFLEASSLGHQEARAHLDRLGPGE